MISLKELEKKSISRRIPIIGLEKGNGLQSVEIKQKG
jgi:hypothetical protein